MEKATAPFQYALSTRAGCECIGHALQFLTERDPSATITSIDGISAFDTISRTAMMSGLAEVDPTVVPFVCLFYRSKSRYLWEDNEGNCHTIAQAEGGEQGVGQHRALVAVHSRLLPSESLMAYLDDTYVVSSPERVEHVHTALEEELFIATSGSMQGKLGCGTRLVSDPMCVTCWNISQHATIQDLCGEGRRCPRTSRE